MNINKKPSKSFAPEAWKEKSREIAIYVGLGLLGLGILILGWQIFGWLRDGRWPPLPVWTAFSSPFLISSPEQQAILARNSFYTGPFMTWLWKPNSWFGLHRLIMWILELPLSLPPVLSGIIISWAALREGDN